MDVSVIIVNYNTRQMTCDCLSSVQKQTKDIDYEIIVVDNASTDDSVAYLKTNFGGIKVISSEQNKGFGKANNIGASYAKGKYLFFLNSDTLLLNNAIKRFYDRMEKDMTLGAAGGILQDEAGQTAQSYNCFPSPKSEIKYIIDKLCCRSTIPATPTEAIYVDFISGADLFISKELFNRLNGFDPVYFMYYEETDLQKRMASLGLKRIILPGVRIMHLEGGSFLKKGLSFDRFMISQKSMNYYISKHYKGLSKYTFKGVMVILRLTLFIKNWTWKERFTAYLQVWK